MKYISKVKVNGQSYILSSQDVEEPIRIDMTGFEADGIIVEIFTDGSTKTTTMEFDENGNPIKITDGDGNITNLTW